MQLVLKIRPQSLNPAVLVWSEKNILQILNGFSLESEIR